MPVLQKPWFLDEILPRQLMGLEPPVQHFLLGTKQGAATTIGSLGESLLSHLLFWQK